MASLTTHVSATNATDFGIALGAASIVQVASLELFVGLVVLTQQSRIVATALWYVAISLSEDYHFFADINPFEINLNKHYVFMLLVYWIFCMDFTCTISIIVLEFGDEYVFTCSRTGSNQGESKR